MKKIISLIVALVISFSFMQTEVYADNKDNRFTNLISHGIYKVQGHGGDFIPGVYKIELLSKESIGYVFVMSKDSDLRYIRRFKNSSEMESRVCVIGPLEEGDSVIIYGECEFYFNKIKDGFYCN